MKPSLAPDLTLRQHAEAWWRDEGHAVPRWRSVDWWAMYEKWVEYAFEGIVGDYEPIEDLAGSSEEV